MGKLSTKLSEICSLVKAFKHENDVLLNVAHEAGFFKKSLNCYRAGSVWLCMKVTAVK